MSGGCKRGREDDTGSGGSPVKMSRKDTHGDFVGDAVIEFSRFLHESGDDVFFEEMYRGAVGPFLDAFYPSVRGQSRVDLLHDLGDLFCVKREAYMKTFALETFLQHLEDPELARRIFMSSFSEVPSEKASAIWGTMQRELMSRQ